MTDIAQVGEWEFKVQACINFGFGDNLCTESNTLTLQVKNPCIITNINTSTINRSLEGAYASPNSYEVTGWTFTDSIDM